VPPRIDVAKRPDDPLTRFAFYRRRQLGEWSKNVGFLGVAVNVTPSIIGNPELVAVIKTRPASRRLPSNADDRGDRKRAIRPRAQSPRWRNCELGARISIDDFAPATSPYLKQAGRRTQDRQVLRDEYADGRGRSRIVEQIVALGHAFARGGC
jgi:hypothetical protein